MNDAINNLIEELEDEQLAACMGGCVNANPSGNSVKYVVGPDGDLQGTADASGQLDNPGRGKNGLDYVGDINSSVRYCYSDRNAKESFAEVNVQQVLEKVATLPITTWKYTEEPGSVRHIGPMAQDFAAAFGVGNTDRAIHVVDANGVTLAAIQALYQMLQERDAELNSLKAEIQALKQQAQVAA